MTREELIGILVLVVAVIVAVNVARKGWNSFWGILVKVFFFPVTIAVFFYRQKKQRKKSQREREVHFFIW